MSEPLAPSLALCMMTTESMRPTVEAGDFILIEEAGARLFEPGDLALLPAASESAARIVHRVIEIRRIGNERWLVTKGDARRDIGAPIREAAVAGRAARLGRPNQAWIRLDLAPARWSGRAAAAAFAWAAARESDPSWRRLERGILAVFGLAWIDPVLQGLYCATLGRRWTWARGLRRGLLSVALDGERRIQRGPILALECVNRLGCRMVAWGLRAARLQAVWGFERRPAP